MSIGPLVLYPRYPGSVYRMTKAHNWDKLRAITDCLARGVVQRNVFVGGSWDIPVLATGTHDLPNWIPVGIDNRNDLISDFDNANGGTLVVQFRFMVQVNSSAFSITPALYDITAAGAATIAGAAACNATDEDFSGTNQQQTITVTLPTALHYFKPRYTVAGTLGGSPAEAARIECVYDCYIDA